MGFQTYHFEHYQPMLTLDVINGITPIKTEPQVLRAISELISAQILTQQIVQQLATAQLGKVATGQAFIGQGQRISEARGFDESAEPVRLLSQRIEELERRLDEAVPKKAGAATTSR